MQLSSFTQQPSNIMLSLPNFREYDDVDLAESPNDSEALLAAKFTEWMRWRQEVCKHEECEECEAREHAECEAQEASEQAECKEQEEWDARKRRGRKERERSAREEVRRGKVSAG